MLPPRAILEALDEPAMDVADAARRYLCVLLLRLPGETLVSSGQGQGQGGGAAQLSAAVQVWLSVRLAAYDAACDAAACEEVWDAQASKVPGPPAAVSKPSPAPPAPPGAGPLPGLSPGPLRHSAGN